MPRRPAKTPARSKVPARPAKSAAAAKPAKTKGKIAAAQGSAKTTGSSAKKSVAPPNTKPAPQAKAKPATPDLRLATATQPPQPAALPAAAPAEAPARTHLPRPGESKNDWFARVAHDYYRFLYATALSITRNNDDAEDAVQNGIMNGMRRLDQLTEEGAIVSWLAMITRNAALDLLRRRKRTPGGGGDSTVLPLSAPDENDNAFRLHDDLREVLARTISVLPASYQEVINARHFRGLEVEDIAKDLGVTENNVRVRLFRAYEKLRESAQIRRAMGLPAERPD